jgi:MoaA/NifB/PqqE/SkfB family radical SAM enzyme
MEAKTSQMKPPVMLFFSHGNICNYKCIFCANPDIDKQWRLKTEYDWINKYRDLISTAKICDISGYGEVILSPDFEMIMDLFKSYGVKATFSTNGFAIGEKIPFLKQSLIEHLNFSINAIHEDTYKKISGGGGDLNLVLSNFGKMREGRNFEISVSIVLNKWIIPELIEWTEFMISKHPDEIRLLPMTNIRDRDYTIRQNNTPLDVTQEDYATIKQARQMVIDAGINIHPTGTILNKTEIQEKKRNCKAPWEQMVLEWDGKVAACCWRHEDPMGDISKDNIEKIWTSEKYQKLRDAMANGGHPFCDDCREFG